MHRAKRVLAILNEDQALEIEPGKAHDETKLLKSQLDCDKINILADKQEGQLLNHSQDIISWDNWDPMMEDYRSARNTLALNPDSDPISSITGKVRAIDSKIGNVTICEHYAKFGNCANGEYCDRIHIDPKSRDRIWALQNTYESNRNRICLNLTYLSPIELDVDPKILLLVSVTRANSPNDFYFIAPYDNMNFANYSDEDLKFYIDRVQQTSCARTKLQKFDDQLASLFDHPYRIDNITDEIYLGQVVACKLEDGRFRRALILDRPDISKENFYYKLLLIDVGVEVELLREQIYDIKAQCLSEPPLAVNCRLSLKPSDNKTEWSSEAIDIFRSETRGEKYLFCKIVDYSNYDEMYVVELYNLVNRKSISDVLINNGYATKGFTYVKRNKTFDTRQ